MEGQDSLLISSLQQLGFKIPSQIQDIAEISGDLLIQLSFEFLQKLGHEVKPLQTQQKFRIASKLSEDINKLEGIRIDVNQLLNPQKGELRKILVSMITKLSTQDDESKQKSQFQSQDDKLIEAKHKEKVVTVQEWLKEDWIHPCLLNVNSKKVRFYDAQINLTSKQIFKGLVIDSFDFDLKNTLFTGLIKMLNSAKLRTLDQNRQKEHYYTGNEKQKKLEKHTLELQDMKVKNQQEWNNLKRKKLEKVVQKLKGQQTEQDEENVQGQKQVVVEEQNYFTAQIQYQQETKQTVLVQNKNEEATENSGQQQSKPEENKQDNGNNNSEFDIDTMKKKNKQESDDLNAQLEEINNQIKKYETKRIQMEEIIQQKLEDIEKYKYQNKEYEIKVDSLHLMLQQLENQKEDNTKLINDIKALNQETEQSQKEWQQAKDQQENQIEQYRAQILQRKEKIDQQREKGKRLETDYSQLIQQIRSGIEKKQQLIEEYNRMPKEGNRMVYVQRIQEITQTYQKQCDDIKKTVQDVEELDRQIEFEIQALDKQKIFFENLYNQDPKKNESLSKQIYKIYQQYCEIFSQTIANLKEVAYKKIEARELEVKNEKILGKGYKITLDRLKQDLTDLKNDNKKLETLKSQIPQPQIQQQIQQQTE